MLRRAVAANSVRGEFRFGGFPILASVAGWASASLPNLVGPLGDFLLRHVSVRRRHGSPPFLSLVLHRPVNRCLTVIQDQTGEMGQ
jgi:hypothetical protein